jgi:hypothetical protein
MIRHSIFGANALKISDLCTKLSVLMCAIACLLLIACGVSIIQFEIT